MKLPTGPMIVSNSTNCSTTNTAAITASQRGNRPCRAAHTTGPASMMAATVSTGPRIEAISASARAVAGSSDPACSASPAPNHVEIPTCAIRTAAPTVNT